MLLEEAYYRESPARLKVIIPKHNQLSNRFCRWLQRVHRVRAVQESKAIDVQFQFRSCRVIAELKVCFGVGPRKSIREAIGQLLEYNHYRSRKGADEWWIVLDQEPADADKEYVATLRKVRSLPVRLGWIRNSFFSFYPNLGSRK